MCLMPICSGVLTSTPPTDCYAANRLFFSGEKVATVTANGHQAGTTNAVANGAPS
jgi:hypothetical protein